MSSIDIAEKPAKGKARVTKGVKPRLLNHIKFIMMKILEKPNSMRYLLNLNLLIY